MFFTQLNYKNNNGDTIKQVVRLFQDNVCAETMKELTYKEFYKKASEMIERFQSGFENFNPKIDPFINKYISKHGKINKEELIIKLTEKFYCFIYIDPTPMKFFPEGSVFFSTTLYNEN